MYLTPHAPKYGKPSASGLSEAGAPEIEVTPAMIAAGLEEYYSVWTELRDAEPGAAEAMLRRAFLAMASLGDAPA
jgi:hypothetical protein